MSDGIKDVPIEGSTPSPAAQCRFKIWRCKPGADVRGACINQTVYGAKVHFFAGRSVPCGADFGHCRFCGPCPDVRWYGYMPILQVSGVARVWLAEITYDAALTCQTLHQPGVSLRSKILHVRRTGADVRGPVVCTFDGLYKAGSLPPPVNVKDALEKIWKCRHTQAGFQVFTEEGGWKDAN